MKIENVLIELTNLLENWGIVESDWILVANYSYRLLGYNVKLRSGHLNVLIKKDKIPWRVREGIEIHPPRNTKFRDDFRKFIEKTGFDFDINLASRKEFKDKRGKYVLYMLPDARRVRLQTPEGAIAEFEKLLALSTKEGLGEERLEKDISYIKNMIQDLSKKDEKNTLELFQKLLKKYQLARKIYIKKKGIVTSGIYGIVASEGKVTGKVAIVRNLQDAQKLFAGDILVTKMTSPKFTEILPRISAIVADQGGMLSHAAILAREMKVPCVVGTRIATQVLKNGDLVEVDAQEGLVRKIEDNEN